ncbi:unnamed protein product [Rotaria magnacalcarata]|uniref:MULE transposase domain-containing protein n=1 Tax=Rotaria magnacalcarata TaxID=392030 RepID=A0A820QM37_9BILA|nr:unnamed protein product [Rotaria magnacalcarata]
MATNFDSENSSCKTQHSDISFSISNKGKQLLIYENYVFKCNKATANKKYWLCGEQECSVYIHTTVANEMICIKGDHNHPSNPDQLEAKLVRDKMKERIISETTSITKIYDEEVTKANLSKGAAVVLPTVVEYRSNMSKARRKNTPVIPLSEMFDIPELYQQTPSAKRFLLIDVCLKRSKNRVLVFASDQQLELLFESDTIFMDGTFNISPAQFKQVYLIHAHKFGQGLPVAFCLLPNKRGKTYTELFERLKDQATAMDKQFNPQRIVTDFEPSLLSVVEQEFPAATHSGCMFHFNQAIHRKIKDLGLATKYLHDEIIRDQCRQLMALSLMPMDQVESQFQRLQTIISTSLGDLLSYFKHQWMYGVVPLQMWNFHDVIHRTNNTSEAYNLRFATRLSKKHPNIWSFIQLIQSEHVRFEHILVQLNAGASAPKQSTKTTAFQMRFDTLHSRFLKKEINANELLPGLSLLIGKKKNRCIYIVNFL